MLSDGYPPSRESSNYGAKIDNFDQVNSKNTDELYYILENQNIDLPLEEETK